MADCLISPVTEIGKCIMTQCLWPPIKSHFDYWWCFHDNIQGLRDGIDKLERKKRYIEQEIERARLRTDIPCPEVEEWLKASIKKLEEAQKILLPDDNIPKAWNLISRYSLGQNAKNTAEEIANLRNEGNFNLIADPAPPAAMASPYCRPTMEFESRKSIEKDIIDSLKKSSVGMIVICGMGGVGKTTLAQRIGKGMQEEKLIDEVVTVTVSQKIDMLKIQNEIAEWLNLKFDVESISVRARQLRRRLMDKTKKIIIFDDVWESLEFEDLGIPIESNFERCKVLLTSRSRHACKRIKNKKVFELKILEEEEAWNLFSENAGKCIENSALWPLARDVAAECKGLPIALVTVGLALQDETDKHTWKHSLSKLKESKPTDLPKEIMTHVYGSLGLSYEKLDNHVEKMFFLLCCLFPVDYDIPLDDLTWYCMSLHMFDDINIEGAINKTHTLVGKLKSRFLLIDSSCELHVKMHDVVRDVAIYIGSKENNGFLKSLSMTSIENSSDVNCNWLSVDISNGGMEVPVLSRFPKLRLLMLSCNEFYDMSDISFEGIEDLNVLSFRSVSNGSLPPKLGSLKNLQMLLLFDCEVENISAIGELTSLKILGCSECQNIRELPAEFGRLKGLRLLELSGCHKLQRIPFGIISNLQRLEKLKMVRSFSGWEAEENGKERRNASLRELECLTTLSCLEIEIDDCTLSAQEICLPQNLVKYYIRIGSQIDYDCFEETDYDNVIYEKVMILNLPSNIGAVGKWLQKRVRNTEGLYLRGDGSGSNNFNIAETENLRNLKFIKCSTVKKLDIVFRSLESLQLHEFKNLEEICEPTIIPNQYVSSLGNLKCIQISSCPKLRYLFSVSVARTSLLQLELLMIIHCDTMEQVFWSEARDDNTTCCIEFPKLKDLALLYLPNLTAFCQGLENTIIKFPNLTRMTIGGLPKLNSLSPLNSETVVWHDHNTCFHFLCNPKVEIGPLKILSLVSFGDNIRNIWCHQIPNNVFNNLEILHIYDMNGIRSIMSTSTARNLVSLKLLHIGECREMVEVIEADDDDEQVAESLSLRGDGSDNINLPKMDNLRNLEFTNSSTAKKLENTDVCIVFPKLKQLTLKHLPNLTAFSQRIENIKFPNLRYLNIGGLPKLNNLCPLNSGCDPNTCSHFVCNPKVELGLLVDLVLSSFGDNIKNIWCYQIPNKVFNNLNELSIFDMNGIGSLMSTSIAKNLVSLKSLFIIKCKEMVEVIERNDDDKQVVDINCFFPNLENLRIVKLPKLRRFWHWNHALQLSLLAYVDINNCPAMETFTLGSINTTKKMVIYINHKEIDDKKDLNHVIHKYNKTLGQNMDEGKNEDVDEEGNGDENENKDEDEDQYKIFSLSNLYFTPYSMYMNE